MWALLALFAAARAYAPAPALCAGALTISIDGAPSAWQVATAAWSHTSASGASLTLNYNERAYLVSACAPGSDFSAGMFSQRFPMAGRVWNFTVDLSSASCGCNAAMYAVAMPAVGAGGAPDPSSSGDFYCDANDVSQLWCTEVDLLEANTAAMAATPHRCQAAQPSGFVPGCDRGGCSVNSKATAGRFGPGSAFAVDTRRPFTVSTAFPLTASGDIAAVSTLVAQPGSAGFAMQHTEATCGAGYFRNMTLPLREGMVPVFSVWGDRDSGSGMSWLDVPPCSPAQGCGASVRAIFSDISFSSL